MSDEGRSGETVRERERRETFASRHARRAFLARPAAFPAQRSAFIVPRVHARCGPGARLAGATALLNFLRIARLRSVLHESLAFQERNPCAPALRLSSVLLLTDANFL